MLLNAFSVILVRSCHLWAGSGLGMLCFFPFGVMFLSSIMNFGEFVTITKIVWMNCWHLWQRIWWRISWKILNMKSKAHICYIGMLPKKLMVYGFITDGNVRTLLIFLAGIVVSLEVHVYSLLLLNTSYSSNLFLVSSYILSTRGLFILELHFFFYWRASYAKAWRFKHKYHQSHSYLHTRKFREWKFFGPKFGHVVWLTRGGRVGVKFLNIIA